MVLNFKYYSLLNQFFNDYETSPLNIEIDFAIEKLISFLYLTEGKNLSAKDIAFFSPKFDYEKAVIRKGGNQTLFNAKVPIEYANLSSICIKFFNEKIKPEAIIQYLASYLFLLNEKLVFDMDFEDKKIIMNPAKLLYFTVCDFKLGRMENKISILVQENIESNYNIKDVLPRKELSAVTKLLAKKGFSFDSYESNWKIIKIEKNPEKVIYYLSYIDIFQFIDYPKLEYFITRILKEMNK